MTRSDQARLLQRKAAQDLAVLHASPISLAWTDFLYSSMTIETTYTAARDQLKALMDRVVEDREVVMVRRRQGGDVAMVAADELEGLLETAHLLRSPRNAARLLSALERARGDSLPALRLEDLEAQLET
jgi:antitoxin YefM